jgi:hypothetical protein
MHGHMNVKFVLASVANRLNRAHSHSKLLTHVLSFYTSVVWDFVAEFLDAFAKVRKATISFVTSVRPNGTTWLPLVRFFVKFEICFSEICRKKFMFG